MLSNKSLKTFARLLAAVMFCFALSSPAQAQFQTANGGVGIDFFTLGIYSNNGNFGTFTVSARLNNDGRVEVRGCVRSNATGIGSAVYSIQAQVIDGNNGANIGTASRFSQPLPGFQQDIPFNQFFFTPASPVVDPSRLELVVTISMTDGNTWVLDTRGRAHGEFFTAPNPDPPGNYNYTTNRWATNNFPTRCGGFTSLPSCPTSGASSFGASPTSINQGGGSTLTWGFPNATSVTIPGVGTFSGSSGSTVVSPSATTTYTATGNGAQDCAPVTLQATVEVIACQTISSYDASATTINQGDNVTFTTNTPNATSATITDLTSGQVFNVGVPNGTLTVTPASTRTYRLTSNGGCAPVTQDITITVVPPPSVVSFSTNVGAVCPGGQAVLSYNTSNATSGDINGTPLPSLPSGTLTVTPAAPFSDFVITVRGGVGGALTDTQTVRVNVTPAPSIDSFSPAPAAIVQGQTSRLNFSSSNSTTQTITDLSTNQVFTVTGQTFLDVTPPSTRTYRYTVSSSCGSTFQDRTVTVTPCQTGSMSASATNIVQGNNVTFTTTAANATSATITDLSTGQVFNVGVPNGTLTVAPASTRTYRYTVNGACGPFTQDITITVAPCQTGSMSANTTAITQGQNVTFTTTAANATSATITDLSTGQVFNVAVPNGTLTVSPASSRTYRYTVNGSCGSATQDIAITVTPCQTIVSYAATQTTINQGQTTRLNYSLTGATSATITDLLTNQVFNVPVQSGFLDVTPSSSRSYRLSAVGPCATVTQTIPITVNPTPVIVSYSSSAPSVCAGGSVVLSYNTQNVTSGNINGTPLPTLPSGTLTVFPTAPSTPYVLTVNGAGGQTATQTISVSVTPATVNNSITPSATTITLGQSVTFTTSATNANSGTVTDLTSGQVINVAVPSGSATFTPAATGARTFRYTANGTCNSPTRDVTITVNPAVVGQVLIGPQGVPAAVGPTSNNDDYTNRTMLAGVTVPFGGLTTAGATINFTNTIRNPQNDQPDTYTLTAPVIPTGFGVQVSTNGGTTFVPLNAGGSTTVTVAANANVDIIVRVTVPNSISVLTGFATTIRATSGITPANFNETIDRVWSGFIRADKTQIVTNSTGVGAANAPVRGATIEYVLTYSNVTPAPAGTGNVDLTATNLVFTENGSAAPNNWATTTTHVAGSASDSRGGTITGDVAGSSVLTDTVPTLAPTQGGTFRFRRTIR